MDLKDIKALVEILESSSIKKLKLKREDVELVLDKESYHQTLNEELVIKTASPARVRTESETNNHAVLAPLVGTFYQASSPENGPFVTLGSAVKKGDTLCIIEAMKVLNEIKAPADGKVVAIHLKDGELAVYDQLLMEIGD